MNGMRPSTAARFASIVAVVALTACAGSSVGQERSVEPIAVDEGFWTYWGDGRAEVATYDLSVPRYGATRTGTAVAVFVTEPFLESSRVKSERSGSDGVVQVIKLNLIKDFPTGVYDYNTMLSAFVGLAESGGRLPGTPAKVSYSSQEWCGHVYHQLLFDRDGVRETSHSYFEGEADHDGSLPRPPDGIAEDALYLWARGLASPPIAPGERRRVSLLRSLEDARLRHRDVDWSGATLRRASEPVTIEVPAGSFEADRLTVEIEGGRTWTFDVERSAPHRLLRWETSEGERAELVASERLTYWSLNGPAGRERLDDIGLTPRPPRTP